MGNHDLLVILVNEAIRHGVAVRVPECQVRRGGDLETLILDVTEMARICKRLAARATESVHVGPIITAAGICWVGACSPGRSRRNSVTGGKDQPQFPSTQSPLSRSRPHGNCRLPSAVHHKRASNVE